MQSACLDSTFRISWDNTLELLARPVYDTLCFSRSVNTVALLEINNLSAICTSKISFIARLDKFSSLFTNQRIASRCSTSARSISENTSKNAALTLCVNRDRSGLTVQMLNSSLDALYCGLCVACGSFDVIKLINNIISCLIVNILDSLRNAINIRSYCRKVQTVQILQRICRIFNFTLRICEGNTVCFTKLCD